MRIDRPCRIVVNDEIIEAAVRDVSVGGARLHVAPSAGPNLKKGTHGTLEFLPHSGQPMMQQMPIEIRNRVNPPSDEPETRPTTSAPNSMPICDRSIR